jgi:hypothetical protein
MDANTSARKNLLRHNVASGIIISFPAEKARKKSDKYKILRFYQWRREQSIQDLNRDTGVPMRES